MLCSQIEELGSEGRVEEAQGMMKLVEQLKEEREQLSSTPSVSSKSLTALLWHLWLLCFGMESMVQCNSNFSQDA